MSQIKVDEKSNEITAIPEILSVLDTNGCVVTIDAMGCQKNIAEQIKKGGDYIFALKGNQGNLHEQVKDFAKISIETSFEDVEYEKYVTTEKDHGRLKTRKYYLVKNLDWLDNKKAWYGLNSVEIHLIADVAIDALQINYYHVVVYSLSPLITHIKI